MESYKKLMSGLMIIAFILTVMLPVTPVYAFSLSDLLGQAEKSVETGKTSEMTNNNFLNILLSLMMGKSLENGSNSATDQVISDKPASTLTNLSPKEFVGFYAEWWGADDSSYNSMIKNADIIKTIAPFWATIEADGTLTNRGGKDHAAVVKAARQRNITTLLLVNNAKQGTGSTLPIHNVLGNPALRTKAIDNLEMYVKQYGLDGINIDFEMVPAADRSNLTAFMRELSGRFKPQGYIVSIDVFPKQNEDSDVAAAYDYTELSKHVDKIMLMTYDNHGTWSGPGPIADVRWVENNLKYALQFIPKNKLYLGIAAYGYDWSSRGVESLDYKAITDLVSRYKTDIMWDEPSKSPHISYTATDGVVHTVWFENSESLMYKLALINKYDIAGAAMWKLGEEDPALWQQLQSTFGK